METPEQYVKSVQTDIKDSKTVLRTDLTPCFSFSIVDFGQVNVTWGKLDAKNVTAFFYTEC